MSVFISFLVAVIVANTFSSLSKIQRDIDVLYNLIRVNSDVTHEMIFNLNHTYVDEEEGEQNGKL